MTARPIAREIKRPVARSILPRADSAPADAVTFNGKPVTFLGKIVKLGN
jgi:hypothetical protein